MRLGSGGGGGGPLSASAGSVAALNLNGIADMRSGGSVLKALSAAEGAFPREHCPRAGRAELCRKHCPQAGCAELTRASSACRIYKLFIYAEKALRYLGEPFLYVLKLAKLNLDGIAAMRSGGSVLEAPPGAEEGALPREHRPQAGHTERCREHRPRAGCTERYREREPATSAQSR